MKKRLPVSVLAGLLLVGTLSSVSAIDGGDIPGTTSSVLSAQTADYTVAAPRNGLTALAAYSPVMEYDYGNYSGVPVYIDGKRAAFNTPATIIDSTLYVPIRKFSMLMGAESVDWDGGTATVTAPGLSVDAASDGVYIVANGRYLFAPSGFAMQDDTLMVPLRILAKSFDAEVTWNDSENAAYITSGSGAIESGDSYYDSTDLYWLSRIICAEARGESLTGKIAVGNVILNRVNSPTFPKSVYNVIFDKRYGIQFTPAYSGAINCTPSEECIIAAKIALDGGNTAGDSLYFSSVANCWAARSRPYEMTIGNHYFFA